MKRVLQISISLLLGFLLFKFNTSSVSAQTCPSGSTCYSMTAGECSAVGGTNQNCTLSGGGTGSCCVPEAPTCPGGMECISGVSAGECTGAGGIVRSCQLSGGGFGNCCVSDLTCPSGTQCSPGVSAGECTGAGGTVQSCSTSGGSIGNCCLPSPGPTCDPGENCCTCTLEAPVGGGGYCNVNQGTNNCSSGYIPICPDRVLCSEGAPSCGCQSSSVIDCGEENEPCCGGGSTCVDPLECVTLGPGGYRCLRPCNTASDCNTGAGEICWNGGCTANLYVPPPLNAPEVFCVGNNPSQRTSNPASGKLATAIGCIPVASSQEFLEFLLRWALGIAGGIALILIVYAGFLIITSAGDPKKLQAGKELLTSAVMGLVLILFAAFILQFIGVTILNIPGFGT